ncbi:hypothetical protein MLD38_014865 [Melastoma candidum]|uniref:Uncharacterized protein n=1 Tax=Melastoma candidum TaxID=119954 RepID=A0ACB9RHV7_9MYRT|nr:hypothetical protein MLD38_014865 [Melastoma candidum]
MKMTVEGNGRGGAGMRDEGSRDLFPAGMRVLAVDDDSTFLKVLEKMLSDCKYHVTTTNDGATALRLLRENRNSFDLVMSDVQMPEIDGFKLLETVVFEMDLPVIMLSSYGDTKLVMRGVYHGASDYLVKPVRMEELKNIWQHVLRKNFNSKAKNDCPNLDKVDDREVGVVSNVAASGDLPGNLTKRRKEQNDDDDEDEDSEDGGQENEEPSSQKKPRVVWSVELHQKFIDAVNQLGLEKAVPKKILDIMNVEGITRENVASHLQKYRLYLKKAREFAPSKDASYLRLASLDRYREFRALTGSRRLSRNTSLSSYSAIGMLGTFNPTSYIGFQGNASSGVSSPNYLQTLNSSFTSSGKLQQVSLRANQSSSMLQGVPTTLNFNNIINTSIKVAGSNLDMGSSANGLGNSFYNGMSSHVFTQGSPLQLQNASSAGVTTSASWQGVAQYSNFPSTTLNQHASTNLRGNFNLTSPDACESLIDFPSTGAICGTLEDSRRDIECDGGLIDNVVRRVNYGLSQHGEEQHGTYKQISSSTNALVPANGASGSVSQRVTQNGNTIYSGVPDVSVMGQHEQHDFSGVHHNSSTDVSYVDHMTKCNDLSSLEHMKQQGSIYDTSYEYFDELMNAVIKRDHNGEMTLMDGDMIFDASQLGSCI